MHHPSVMLFQDLWHFICLNSSYSNCSEMTIYFVAMHGNDAANQFQFNSMNSTPISFRQTFVCLRNCDSCTLNTKLQMVSMSKCPNSRSLDGLVLAEWCLEYSLSKTPSFTNTIVKPTAKLFLISPCIGKTMF